MFIRAAVFEIAGGVWPTPLGKKVWVPKGLVKEGLTSFFIVLCDIGSPFICYQSTKLCSHIRASSKLHSTKLED